ncbi:MAG: AIR synthase-related protein, partial [Candidatus Promineifilaceae bacterium]|nr:AIR synthase-related protein [Candidatus Promineifilaceae bacterium]
KSVTDITGFGLLGHAHELAHLSNVALRIDVGQLRFLPGAVDYGRAGAFPGGMANNLAYFGPWVRFASSVDQLMQDMLWTPETSGGLLVAVKPDAVDRFRELCPADIIGSVMEGNGQIEVVT